MKMRYLLLVVVALLLPAGFASAGPVDPSVIINSKGPSGGVNNTPDVLTFSSNSLKDPLMINLTDGLFPLELFEYTGSKTLTELFVQLNGVLPDEGYFCKSDIFTGACGGFLPNQDRYPDSLGLIFKGGTLTQGTEFTVQVVTPEPGTLILLLSGMLPLLFFGRKRWAVSRAV